MTHRDAVPKSPHATHAMALQMLEYQTRVERACASTYQFALRRPVSSCPPSSPSSSAPRHTRRRHAGYARARILESGRDPFHTATRAGSPALPSSSSSSSRAPAIVDSSPGGAFFRQVPRRDEFLFTGHDGARPHTTTASAICAAATGSSIIPKDLFALGPGQYDPSDAITTTNSSPSAPPPPSASLKFSPSDRFHEDYQTPRPGPGQYLTSEVLVSPRARAAVFSQLPRTPPETHTPASAHVVSSYYYVPASAFQQGHEATAPHAGWSRSARFMARDANGRRLRTPPPTRRTTASTDYIAKNVARVLLPPAPAPALPSPMHQQQERGVPRRRSSLLSVSAAPVSTRISSSSPSPRHATNGMPRHCLLRRRSLGDEPTALRQQLVQPTWVAVAFLAGAQARLSRLFQLATLLRRMQWMQEQHVLEVTLRAWRNCDVHRRRAYASTVITRNSFALRFWLRVERRRRHAALLRQVLRGLSLDVRFALAMKRIKRRVQLLQRWWRHVQLMVHAREQALVHKWLAVEARLRSEHVAQMPHLSRILAMGVNGNGNGLGSSGGGGGTATSSELALPRLLHLPCQETWFSARFVLTADGVLRGYSACNRAMDAARVDGTTESEMESLVVEVKSFRCQFHDASESHPESCADWKPFLLVMRPGMYRFVVIASASVLPSEILSWKDKLMERGISSSSSLPHTSSNGSFRGLTHAGGGSSAHTGHDGGLLEPGGSSRALVPTRRSSSSMRIPTVTAASGSVNTSSSTGSVAGSNNTAATTTGSTTNAGSTTSPVMRGRLQTRMRTMRMGNSSKPSATLISGDLKYYVVDLLKDMPRVPTSLVWSTIRSKLREKRKAFRAEIYRYKLELFHYHQHHEQVKHLHVREKFRDFFARERPHRPHFRSLISNRKMETLIRQTVEQVKTAAPPDPRLLLEAGKPVLAGDLVNASV